MSQTKYTPGKCGKKKVKDDPRTFDISDYIAASCLRTVPEQHDWTQVKKTVWGRLKNTQLNNCTCAAAGHMIKCWTANTSVEYRIRTKDVVAAYAALSGYDVKTGQNDTGVTALDALKYWRKNGIGDHKIKAFARVGHGRPEIVKATLYHFGGVYVGLQLPESVEGQKVWEVGPGGLRGKQRKGSLGGHAVSVLAYDDKHLTCVSWGREHKMTWEFWEAYCDEMYAIITEDFFKGKKTPTGLKLKTLEKDLMSLTSQKVRLGKQLDANKDANGKDVKRIKK